MSLVDLVRELTTDLKRRAAEERATNPDPYPDTALCATEKLVAYAEALVDIETREDPAVGDDTTLCFSIEEHVAFTDEERAVWRAAFALPPPSNTILSDRPIWRMRNADGAVRDLRAASEVLLQDMKSRLAAGRRVIDG